MAPWWLRPTAENEKTPPPPPEQSAPTPAPAPASEPTPAPDTPADTGGGSKGRTGRSGRRGRSNAGTAAAAEPQSNETSSEAPESTGGAEGTEANGRSRSRSRRRGGRGRRGGGGGRTADGIEASEAPSTPAPRAATVETVKPGANVSVPLAPSEPRELVISVTDSARTDADERRIAVFCDLENVALGAKESGSSFQIQLVLERLVDKGKILVKKAYADWNRYAEYKRPFHEAGIELIDIPQKRISGKNSADIKMVVDAMDISWSKEHIDTFALLSGDSDFSPLVAKLKENNKFVIGIGVKGSSSKLLVDACDEFVYYEDIWRDRQQAPTLDELSDKDREVFGLLLESIHALKRENKDVLWSSMIKQTIQRKRPSFNEGYYGYSTFSELLEEARRRQIVSLEKDRRSGSYIVGEVDNRKR